MKINGTWQRAFFWAVMAAGVVLRLFHYFSNRSLWIDEASLALNLIHRNFAELLQPLDHNQVAPVLFLWIERLFVELFGPGELALRLFPLISSIISLPLMFLLAKKLTGDINSAITALFIFSLSPLMIYFSAEVKQYSIDVLCTLSLGYFYADYISGIRTNRKILTITIINVLFIFLSNITVILLTAVYIYFLYEFIRDRKIEWKPVLSGLITGSVFLMYYIIFIHGHPSQAYMLDFWQSSFMPQNIFSHEFRMWIFRVVSRIFTTMISYYDIKTWWVIFYDIVYFVIAAIAVLAIMKKRNYFAVHFLLLPIFIHLLLSAFQMYPFHTRLVLYLYPLVMILIANGIIITAIEIRRRSMRPVLSYLFLAGMLAVFPPVLLKTYPVERAEIKQSLAYLEDNSTAGQDIYVYYRGYTSFRYYQEIGFVKTQSRIVKGSNKILDDKGFYKELERVPGQAWFLFTHAKPLENGETEETVIIRRLGEERKLLKKSTVKGSSVYLFDRPGP